MTTILDTDGEVRIPAPTELHPGDLVEVEVVFFPHTRTSGASGKSWSELLDSVEGILADYPLEIPDDPIPS